MHRDGAAKTLQGVPGRDLHETAGSPRDVPGPRSGPRKAFPARFFASASSCIPYALHISPFLASAVPIRLLVTSRDHVQPLSNKGQSVYHLRIACIKLEKLGAEYNPREDTCVKAFVRMLAERALAAASGSDD